MTAAADYAAPSPNPSRAVLLACAILGAFFFTAVAIYYLMTLDLRGPIPRDGSSLVVGRDFLNFWMYGKAAMLPELPRWYDPVLYQQAIAKLVGEGYPGQNWSYPPSLMLITAPFGRLDYLPALLLWTALGLAVFLPMAWRYLPDRHAFIAAIFSPAAVFGLISGQISFLTTAMMLGAFAWLDRRPVSAGILIGMLTIKPHVGLLFPVLLAVSGRWRVFAVATGTTLALAALTALLFGAQVWIDFFRIGLPVQNIVLLDPDSIAQPFFPTVFMNLRGMGLSYDASMTLQVMVTVVMVALVAWAFKHRANADPHQLQALFFACSVAAVPYLLSYGVIAMTMSALALLASGELDARGRLMARLAYWLPLIQMVFGTFDIPGPALVAPVFALYVFMRLKNRTAPQPMLRAA